METRREREEEMEGEREGRREKKDKGKYDSRVGGGGGEFWLTLVNDPSSKLST